MRKQIMILVDINVGLNESPDKVGRAAFDQVKGAFPATARYLGLVRHYREETEPGKITAYSVQVTAHAERDEL